MVEEIKDIINKLNKDKTNLYNDFKITIYFKNKVSHIEILRCYNYFTICLNADINHKLKSVFYLTDKNIHLLSKVVEIHIKELIKFDSNNGNIFINLKNKYDFNYHKNIIREV